jgi:hypothetical protein
VNGTSAHAATDHVLRG